MTGNLTDWKKATLGFHAFMACAVAFIVFNELYVLPTQTVDWFRPYDTPDESTTMNIVYGECGLVGVGNICLYYLVKVAYDSNKALKVVKTR
jgi:hypothetical protein